jgi:hypothetical protein
MDVHVSATTSSTASRPSRPSMSRLCSRTVSYELGTLYRELAARMSPKVVELMVVLELP